MPSLRNVNAQFLRAVFRGDKRLLNKGDIKHIGKSFGLKNLSTKNMLQNFLERDLASQYIPDSTDLSKIDRKYVLTVNLSGP